MRTAADRSLFVERARALLELAWDVGGAAHVTEPAEIQARVLNGLLALALTEICAPPYGIGVVRLSQVLSAPPEEPF